jgi:hypothetical protein
VDIVLRHRSGFGQVFGGEPGFGIECWQVDSGGNRRLFTRLDLDVPSGPSRSRLGLFELGCELLNLLASHVHALLEILRSRWVFERLVELPEDQIALWQPLGRHVVSRQVLPFLNWWRRRRIILGRIGVSRGIPGGGTTANRTLAATALATCLIPGIYVPALLSIG